MFSLGSNFLAYEQFGCPREPFGRSFGEVFGYLGEHFGGLGGSWEKGWNFGSSPGITQIEVIWSG